MIDDYWTCVDIMFSSNITIIAVMCFIKWWRVSIDVIIQWERERDEEIFSRIFYWLSINIDHDDDVK